MAKIRFVRNRFVEFKGRGDYHQIDIPVDLIYRPSFIYPIRLLGEVKFRSCPIDKSYIREEIGKMKDIQENYFVDGSLTDEMRAKRRLEVFSFFSASGFNEPAERLAYAHGIKTISYKNNKCIYDIVRYIRFISKTISSYSEADQTKVIDDIFNILIINGGGIIDFSVLPGFSTKRRCPKSIKTSILGTTSTGLTIHLVSSDSFPDELFKTRDFVYCRVKSTDDYDKWQLEFKESKFVLYFFNA